MRTIRMPRKSDGQYSFVQSEGFELVVRRTPVRHIPFCLII